MSKSSKWKLQRLGEIDGLERRMLRRESNANHDIRVRNFWQVEFKLESLESRTGIQLFVVQLQVTVSDLCKRPT